MSATTQTYIVQIASQKLGKEGDTVALTDSQAKYWLLSGAVKADTSANKAK